jgi:hypothetical protein
MLSIDRLFKEMFDLPTSYFSCLAMPLHMWRDNAKELYHCIAKKFNHTDMGLAFKCGAHRVPQRPISGRWGRVSKCEEYLLNFHTHGMFDKMVECFTIVISSRGYYRQEVENAAGVGRGARGRGRGRRGRGRRGSVDEMATDEQEYVQSAKGKWSRKVSPCARCYRCRVLCVLWGRCVRCHCV